MMILSGVMGSGVAQARRLSEVLARAPIIVCRPIVGGGMACYSE